MLLPDPVRLALKSKSRLEGRERGAPTSVDYTATEGARLRPPHERGSFVPSPAVRCFQVLKNHHDHPARDPRALALGRPLGVAVLPRRAGSNRLVADIQHGVIPRPRSLFSAETDGFHKRHFRAERQRRAAPGSRDRLERGAGHNQVACELALSGDIFAADKCPVCVPSTNLRMRGPLLDFLNSARGVMH